LFGCSVESNYNWNRRHKKCFNRTRSGHCTSHFMIILHMLRPYKWLSLGLTDIINLVS